MTEATLKIKVDSTEVDKASRSLGGLAEASGNTDKSSQKLTKSTENLAGAARMAIGAFTALGASISIREIIQAADAWKSAENQLRLVTTSTADLSNTQKILMGVSNETRSSFESTANLYSRLTRATSEMGLSQTELVGITETINKSFAVSGATATEAAAAITQLSQGLAAGALRGDEFNSVAEQAPGIMQAIAKSLNMTTGELRTFAGEGGVTAEIVVKSLQQASDSIAEDFGKSMMTFGQATQIAKNNALEFVGTSDSLSSAVSYLGELIISASEGFDELGVTVDSVSSLVSDFVEIGSAGLSPFLSDVSNFSQLAAEQISKFGSSVTSTGSTISTGIDQLDEIINSFFSNFSTGSVDAAEMFSLAFGTALPNTRAVIETATVAIADAVERMKIRITMDGAEQEAALSALDSIRNRSINEIIALRDQEMAGIFDLISAQGKERKAVESIIDTTKEFNDETYEAWLATQDMAEGIEVLGNRVAGTDDEIKAFNKSIDEYLKQQKKNQLAVAETISELEMEQVALGMTARAQAVFNAVMKASSDGALPAQIAKIAELTAKNYDLSNSTKVTGSTAEAAAKQSIESWGRTHEYLTSAFIDISNDGGSAFEKIADSAVQSVKRIIAEWLAMKAMNLFGIPTPGGSAGSAGGSAVGSIASSAAQSAIGSAAVRSGIGQFVAGATGGATGIAAGTMGPPTAAAAAGSGIGASIAGAAGAAGSAISGAGSAMMAFAVANPVIAAALAAAALAATLSKEETPSGNAGFLIRDLAGGGDGRTFDVEPFASGFDPVGFARREDQGAAVGVIDTFRQYDAALTSIAKAAGIDVNYNSSNFGGFDEKGRGNGLFFGAANEDGRGSSVPIEQQLDQYVSQWIKGLGGQVDQSLINDVLAAGSADEMVKRAGMIAGIDGSHATGLAYVPFDGYVAELHRGERVVPASENVGDGTMSAMVAELRAMRAELIDIRKNSMDSYNLLDKWDNDPLTVQVAA